MDEATYGALAEAASRLGFATGRLLRTKQSPR
jgi:hypothetical protein